METMNEWTLIAGLGNPGDDYHHTPHNIGFEAIDVLHRHLQAPSWTAEKDRHALISTAKWNDTNLLLVKPTTFMNESGIAIRETANWHRITNEHIIIIHDDIDGRLGTWKMKECGSARGHNGVRSVIAELQSDDFRRVIIGAGIIPRPEHFDAKRYVLTPLDGEQWRTVEKTIEEIPKIIESMIFT